MNWKSMKLKCPNIIMAYLGEFRYWKGSQKDARLNAYHKNKDKDKIYNMSLSMFTVFIDNNETHLVSHAHQYNLLSTLYLV